MKFRTYAERWIDREEKFLHLTSARVYRRLVKRLCDQFGDLPLGKITWRDIRDYMRGLNISRGATGDMMSVMRCVLYGAVEDGLLEDCVMEGKRLRLIRRPEEKNTIDPFDAKERVAILAACEGQDRNILQTMLWTGIRPSEAMGLKWENVDFDEGFVNIVGARASASLRVEAPKSPASQRSIKMLRGARDALMAQRQWTRWKGEWVFFNARTMAPIRCSEILVGILTRACKKAGVRYRHPYTLRHTYASMLLTAGEDLGWIASQMGHTNAMFTAQVYAKCIPLDNPKAGQKAEELFG